MAVSVPVVVVDAAADPARGSWPVTVPAAALTATPAPASAAVRLSAPDPADGARAPTRPAPR